MGTTPACDDNSMVETVIETIKLEPIWPVARHSRQQAENAIARSIDGLYNPVRRRSSLDFRSPTAFERKTREVSCMLSRRTGQAQRRSTKMLSRQRSIACIEIREPTGYSRSV